MKNVPLSIQVRARACWISAVEPQGTPHHDRMHYRPAAPSPSAWAPVSPMMRHARPRTSAPSERSEEEKSFPCAQPIHVRDVSTHRAAIAEKAHLGGKADGRLGRGTVSTKSLNTSRVRSPRVGRKATRLDVDLQNSISSNRHQDDDHVLPVEEMLKMPDDEQCRRHRQYSVPIRRHVVPPGLSPHPWFRGLARWSGLSCGHCDPRVGRP